MSKTLLQINITANWGSTGKIAEEIGSTAIDRGWKSYIAYGRWSKSSKSQLIQIGTKFNTYLHFLEHKFFDREGLSSRMATKHFIKQIEKINPDIVLLHNIHDHYLNYKLLFEFLNQTTIKVVWTFHDCWAFTGHCYHFVTKGCMRWKEGCNNCPLSNEYPKSFSDRSLKNYVIKKTLFSSCKNLSIITCSYWMQGYVKESFLKDKDIRVIHNGVDLELFRPIARGVNPKFKILAVSNIWHQRKGLFDIFKLRESLPIDTYSITVVGLSTEQISSLPSGIEGIQRTENVRELVRLYEEADVFINPSYADTFPTVNIESLACGTPVVLYNTGGSPEAVDGETGVVVNQGDVKAMAKAIISIREHPLSREECHKRAVTFFDKRKNYGLYIDYFEELLKNK